MDNQFDITNQNSSENILLAALLQNTSDIVVVISNDHKIIEINLKAETYFNLKRCDLIGKNYKKICKKFQNSNSMDIKNRAINWTSVDLANSEKEKIAYVLFGKLADSQSPSALIEKMEKENEILKNIISSVPGSIYWKNKEGIYLGCNDFMLKIAGLNSKDDIIGKSDFELWPNQAVTFLENDQRVIQSKDVVQIEEQVDLTDGTKRYFTVHKTPLYDEDKNIIGIVGNSIEITELKKTQINLKTAKEAAEAADKAKTAFIANMSHDIRTPLSGVIEMSEMLERNLENPKHKQEAHLLSMSGSQLLKMLNEILEDVRAGNANETNIQEETFDVYECIQGLIELESPTTAINHLGLQCDIEQDVPRYIVSDRKKIHHILLNLLGNAIKFTKMGHITIQVKCLDSTRYRVHLQFSVADTGMGIPKKLQKKIFERFFRVDPSYKGRYEGYGLGLNIVQSYVSLLGGHITLTSKEGVGTTFHFDLQCKIGKKKDIPQKGTSEKYANFSQNYPPEPQLSNVLHIFSADENTPHLLLVEDSVILLNALELMVSEAGYRFTSVSTGEQAFELAKSERFDLIITDVGLPGMSGIELAQSIQDWENTNDKSPAPIIALTGHGKEGPEAAECMACGMMDVFTKPINLATLQSIVSQWVLKTSMEPQNLTIQKNYIRREKTSSAMDLPDTEEKLFDLGSFLIFDAKDRLKSCKMHVLINTLKLFLSEDQWGQTGLIFQ